MDIGIISSRYAKALFSFANEKGVEEAVYKNLKILASLFFSEPDLLTALKNPILSNEEKKRLLITAGGESVCDLYIRFINLVLRHHRERFLPFMAHSYIRLFRKEKQIKRVHFTSAVPINEKVKLHLIDQLEKQTGGIIEFSGKVNPELLGGFQLRIENERIDASYATQLKHIREQLRENR